MLRRALIKAAAGALVGLAIGLDMVPDQPELQDEELPPLYFKGVRWWTDRELAAGAASQDMIHASEVGYWPSDAPRPLTEAVLRQAFEESQSGDTQLPRVVWVSAAQAADPRYQALL